MRNKILWMLVSCLMALSLVLASCGPAEEETPAKPTPTEEEEEVAPTEEEEEVAPTEEEEEVAPTGEPQYGGTLTVVTYISQYEPQSWDPADCIWNISYYSGLYLETLINGDVLNRGVRGTKEFSFMSYEYIPEETWTGCLAESWEMPDPLTIIFHIRKGVYWQDKPGVMTSREMTADDIVFALQRTYASPKATPERWEDIKSVTAPDKYTVVVKMNSFNSNWGYLMAWGFMNNIYPPELVEAGIGDWKNAVGTGPFMLTDYVPGATVTYKRNPNYWNTTTIAGKEYKFPFVDKLLWPLIPDESTQIAALRTGKCDIEQQVTWRYKDSLAKTNPELLRYPRLDSAPLGIGMRADTRPFDDIRVRRAMNLAIDNQAILDTQYGGLGELQNFAVYANFPETLYTPLDKLPESARELFEYHPDKAKALLTEAGYPDGFKTEVVIQAMSETIDVVSMCKSYWEDIGVDCEIKTVEYGTLHSIMHAQSHEQMLGIYKGVDTNPVITLWLLGVTDQVWNTAMFSDSHYDNLYNQMIAEPDVDERSKLVKEAAVHLIDKSAYVIMPCAVSYHYAWPWVNNFHGEGSAGYFVWGPIFGTVWLDQNLKKEMGY